MTRKDAALHQAAQAPRPEETFAQSGREELSKRAEAFLDWRGAVLTNKDIEAVHKMRVASRRLRATLDAYKPACRAKRFKQAYRTVKKAADLLGAAWGTDVMMQHGKDSWRRRRVKNQQLPARCGGGERYAPTHSQ